MTMEQIGRRAFVDTIPVMTGFLVLGIGFGMLAHANDLGFWYVFGMGFFIYAGSMQYVLVPLITSGASLATAAITTLMVNMRHIFYGITMADRYKTAGKIKPYLIFGLTDETFSLVCNVPDSIPAEKRNRYYFLVTLLDHFYWTLGCVLGSVAGSLIPISTEGIDFSLTALFLTVFTDQWLSTKDHFPALVGLFATLASLLIFGTDVFLIPAMVLISAILIGKEKTKKPVAEAPAANGAEASAKAAEVAEAQEGGDDV